VLAALVALLRRDDEVTDGLLVPALARAGVGGKGRRGAADHALDRQATARAA